MNGVNKILGDVWHLHRGSRISKHLRNAILIETIVLITSVSPFIEVGSLSYFKTSDGGNAGRSPFGFKSDKSVFL